MTAKLVVAVHVETGSYRNKYTPDTSPKKSRTPNNRHVQVKSCNCRGEFATTLFVLTVIVAYR